MDKRSSILVDWLRLAHTRGIGHRAKLTALEQDLSPAQALAACRQARRGGAAGNRFDPDVQVTRDLAWLDQSPTRHIASLDDPVYPSLLRQTDDPPLVLYMEGAVDTLDQPLLAIVGSRNPTVSGREHAVSFARAVALSGIGVVSGLALGIDAAAHRGALETRHATLGICATGLDLVYPKRHSGLARQIVSNGLLMSEFPIATPPRRDHFPQRNRIISGIALGTVVVEAGMRSGSLITARTAVEQGREVFAIPGSIQSPLSRGCHALIKQGAKLVESVADVLEEIAPGLQRLVASAANPKTTPPKDLKHRKMLEFLDFDPTSVDELVHRSGLTADTVSSMLLQLEVDGKVASCPGGRYVRT